ncbi:alpha/beta hydrolase, partial [Alcaligenaceae bacterium 429]
DLLGASTVQEMVTRHPAAHSVEVAGVGHAPTLRHADQIAIVEQFLMG